LCDFDFFAVLIFSTMQIRKMNCEKG